VADLWYLALAYGVIWLGLIGYLFRLAARAESLSRELDLLRGMLQAEEAAAGPDLKRQGHLAGLPDRGMLVVADVGTEPAAEAEAEALMPPEQTVLVPLPAVELEVMAWYLQ